MQEKLYHEKFPEGRVFDKDSAKEAKRKGWFTKSEKVIKECFPESQTKPKKPAKKPGRKPKKQGVLCQKGSTKLQSGESAINTLSKSETSATDIG